MRDRLLRGLPVAVAVIVAAGTVAYMERGRMRPSTPVALVTEGGATRHAGAGDVIRAPGDAQGAARIDLPDGTRVEATGGAVLRLLRLDELSLERGALGVAGGRAPLRVFTRELTIAAPAVARFAIAATDEGSTLRVAAGRVRAVRGATVEVGPGERLVVRRGAIKVPAPERDPDGALSPQR